MRKIDRRDFINGTLMAAGASLLPLGCQRDPDGHLVEQADYPPSLTGLRGSHEGSNTHAHNKAWNNKSDWGRITEIEEDYDLIVVGGGISGLSAAYFYRQKYGADKTVLILDNHDDFGGHAKRNEHQFGENTRLTFGGSQSLQSPHAYSNVAKKMLKDIGADLDRFKTAYDSDFFKNNNLGVVTYFNEKKFGANKVVQHPFSHFYKYYHGLPEPRLSQKEAVDQTPLSEEGKRQLQRVLSGGLYMLEVPQHELEEYIASHSYFDYLKKTLQIDDPKVLEIARTSCSDYAGSGADTLTISEALGCGALGLDPLSWKDVVGEEEYERTLKEHGFVFDERDQYIHHFPDGNATIARLLVKHMIPSVGNGSNAEEIVLSKFDYSRLDVPENKVKIRLNSTVINVRHEGDPTYSDRVFVDYILNDKAFRVKAKGVVMACYNMMIPHIVRELPKPQEVALKRMTKIPLQYTTVGLTNWRAFRELEIGFAMSPGNMHQVVMMDFPVSIGGYDFSKSPDDPCVIQMVGCPFGATVGAPPVEQYKEVRYRMLALQFQDYENEIREHLAGMLSGSAFDFDKDVSSITVNRWAHGYAYAGSALFDPDMSEMARIGRQRFGRITVANTDSGLSSYLDVAVDQAFRAVNELG